MQSSLHGTGSSHDGLVRKALRPQRRFSQHFQCRRRRHDGTPPVPYSTHLPTYLSESQTTASDSALTAAVAARSRYTRAHPGTPHERFVLYTTTQTHSLGAKAALILGLRCRALDVTAGDEYALRGEVLLRALREDVESGLIPFMLSSVFLLLFFNKSCVG